MITAILLFDIMAGLLFFIFYGMKHSAVATDSGMVRILEDDDKRGMEAAENGTDMEEATYIGDVTSIGDVRKIAITFDDGPHPYYTEQLLDGLKERGVVATFFVTGDCVMLLPD